jgi:hypothetical protein
LAVSVSSDHPEATLCSSRLQGLHERDVYW